MRTWSLCTLLAFCSSALAVDLHPMPDENVLGISAALADLVGKHEKFPQKKLGLKSDAARGLLSDDQQYALMIIPASEIKDDRDNPELEKEGGMPIGVMLFHNLLPGDGKDKKKLFEITYTDESGQAREVRFGLLIVRKLEGEDFRIQLLGVDGKPVAEGPLSEEPTDKTAPIDLNYSGEDLEILLLGKYPTLLTVKESPY